ncbi:MAG: type I phosphomannose isomerase catalytic subunit [Spirochaetota bacterium]
MDKKQLYPLKFDPIYKPYIWGGTKLSRLGKRINPGEIVAESWEISDHGRDISTAKNGPLKGKTLRELIKTYGEDICPATDIGRFPILIKYIDASNRLSVQVHPDDRYAREHEPPGEMGKTECWYILDAPPGARLILGAKKGLTRQQFKTLVEENRIEQGLNRINVSRGDVIYIESGTVHALLEGIMVCEVQENSDTTYRLYDWGRVGSNGRPRPLHIEKALDVINYVPEEEYEQYMKKLVIPYDKSKQNVVHSLIREKYFNIDLIKYSKALDMCLEDCHFHTLNILNGEGIIGCPGGELGFQKGDSLLIPRPVGEYTILPGAQKEIADKQKLKGQGVEILQTFL